MIEIYGIELLHPLAELDAIRALQRRGLSKREIALVQTIKTITVEGLFTCLRAHHLPPTWRIRISGPLRPAAG